MIRKKDKNITAKSDRIISISTIISIAIGVVIIIIGMIYYKYRIAELGISDTVKYNEYTYHYAMISEDSDLTFWDDIYQGALEQGTEQNAYVERIGSNLSSSYTLQDLMKIAIASKVDGIILEPNGDQDVTDLILKADEAGIPVVTVLRDEPDSNRISFVGINSYTQGQAYAREVLDIVQGGKKNITILLNEDTANAAQKEIYSSILGAVSDLGVVVKTVTVNDKSAFSSEEDIRNIIVDNKNSPDLLVCLTAVDTICAYQAVVDYNKVGEIDIVGYYDSDTILRAIEKNIVHSTMTINAGQIGAYCVDALTEYIRTNNVSDYYSVDISVINQTNIKDYIKDDTVSNN